MHVKAAPIASNFRTCLRGRGRFPQLSVLEEEVNEGVGDFKLARQDAFSSVSPSQAGNIVGGALKCAGVWGGGAIFGPTLLCSTPTERDCV